MRYLLTLAVAALLLGCNACNSANPTQQFISTDPADVNQVTFRAELTVNGDGQFQTWMGPVPMSYPVIYEGRATITLQASYPVVVVDGEAGFVMEPDQTPGAEAFMQQEIAAGRFLFRLQGQPYNLYKPGSIAARRAGMTASTEAFPEPAAPVGSNDNLGDPPTSEDR